MRTPLWFPLALLAAAMLATMLVAHTIHAQVAAPMLNPLDVQSDSGFNPATLGFSQSAVGGVYVNGVGEDVPLGQPAVEIGSGPGHMLQARWVGETFAASAETFSLDIEFDPVTFIDGSRESSADLLAVAAQYDGFIGLGLAQRNSERVIQSPSSGFVATDEGSLPLLGVALRFAESVYLGAAAGTETFTRTEVTGASVTVEAERDLMAYGVAYRMRDDSTGWHLELYHQEQDALPEIAAVFGGEGLGSSFDGATVEIVLADILLGYERASGEETDAVTGLVVNEIERTSLNLGWVPTQGLSILVGMETTEETDPTNGDVFQTTVTGAGAAWLF